MVVCGCSLVTVGASGVQSSGTLAFIDVSVVPMDSERVLTRHTVIIQGDRIISIDPADEAVVPRGARRIEAQGKYLIPGLIDAHTRLLSDSRISDEHIDEELAVLVANGVTTIRHAAGSPRLLEYRERIIAEDVLGPQLYVSSPQLASIEPDERFAGRFVQTAFEAAAAVRGFREAGYDFVSLAYGNTADVYSGVVLTSRGSRMPLVGHVPALVSLQRALESGQHIEYLDGYLDALLDPRHTGAAGLSGSSLWEKDNWISLQEVDEGRIDDVARATADAEVWNTPLLASLEAALATGRSGAETEESPAERFVSPGVRAALHEARGRYREDPPAEAWRRRYIELRNRIVRELYRADAKLLAGSGDPAWTPPYGFGLHRELESLVAAGLPPYAALRAATRSPAASLSSRGGGSAEFATVDANGIRFESSAIRGADFGSVAVGNRADLVLLAASPLDDISNTQRIEGVMLRGRWLPREELDDLLDRSAAVLSRVVPLLARDQGGEQVSTRFSIAHQPNSLQMLLHTRRMFHQGLPQQSHESFRRQAAVLGRQ